ncbi:hypothetical protein ACFL6S_08955 [Candidatus Poribacteria bacterium]
MIAVRSMIASFFLCSLLAINVSAAVSITNVVVSDGNPAMVDDGLQVGDKAYSDRNYTFGEIPEKYLGLPFIMTPMSSSKDPIEPGLEISFDIDREAYIYLVWATKEAPREWLTDAYVNTEDQIFMGQGMQAWPELHDREVWRSEESFKPGKVTTYEVTQDAAIYIIFVEEAKSGMAVSPSRKLTISWGALKTR